MFLTSCGYYWQHPEELSAYYRTLSVPYIIGDLEGLFTDELVKAVGRSSQFTYSKEGEIILEGKLTNDQTTHIGWQYDRDPVKGERINRLIPNEGRREVTVQFSLVSVRTGQVLYGPIDVTAYTDYDFVDSDSLFDTSFLTPKGGRQSVLFFSLGQLDSTQGAQNAVLKPLYRKLAEKIVRGIENISFSLEQK